MKIGLVIMLEGTAHRAPRFRELRELAVRAEQANLDGLWLYDHLLFGGSEPNGQWECLTMVAALAAVTERITLGTLVVCTAFRNPALLAKTATALDEISEGRFVLGVGAGWNETEFRAFGLPYDHRVDRFEEAMEIIVPLLRTSAVDYQGHYYQAPGCRDLPRGPRVNGPPIMVGGWGPRMLRLAAKHADLLNTSLAPTAPEFLAACAEAGRDPATLPVSWPLWVACPDLGPTPPHMAETQYGDVEAVAEALRGPLKAGVAEIMVDLRPNTLPALERLVAAVEIVRAEQGNIA